jgi:DNA-binding transcriptional ArsR family regulator
VSYWLQSTDGVPFEDYTDLLENRSNESRRADALLWFEEHGVEPDETSVFDDPDAHAAAPLSAFTILAGENLGNGFERADIDGVGAGVRNRENGSVSILRPPSLEYASGVVALDGTPTKELWELALGERLNHRTVLQNDERAEYIQESLNLNLIRTSEHVKPYNSKEHVNTESDGALLEEIGKAHGEQPGLITSSTAISEYKEADVLDLVDGSTYYGNVLGSNEFKEKRLGAVIGSNHYGDGYIKKWGAYAGETVERNDEKGSDLSYGGFGDKVLTHMREHDTLQAVMRFGRDGNGSVVYVHTDTLPEWVPIAGEGRVVNTWSDGMKAVVRTLETLESATTAEIVETVDLSRQQVFEHLETLRERGVLDREQDRIDGRRFVWVDDGLHRIGEHGEAELEPVDLEEIEQSEVRQVARNSIYTWEFTNFNAKDVLDSAQKGSTDTSRPTRATDGGDRPPDPAD